MADDELNKDIVCVCKKTIKQKNIFRHFAKSNLKCKEKFGDERLANLELERKKSLKDAKSKRNQSHYSENKSPLKKRQRVYYAENAPSIVDKKREYNGKNRKKINESKNVYDKQNRERINEKQNVYNKQNRKRINESQNVYNKQNRKRINESQTVYNKQHSKRIKETMQDKRKQMNDEMTNDSRVIRFKRAIIEGPNFICFNCNRSQFKSGIVKLKVKGIQKPDAEINCHDLDVSGI